MRADDGVLSIVARVVKGSRDRAVFSRNAPAVHTDGLAHTRSVDPVTGESVILIPDPDEVLKVRCVACDRVIRRPRRVVERMNGKDGFVACSHGCRKYKLNERERVFHVAAR